MIVFSRFPGDTNHFIPFFFGISAAPVVDPSSNLPSRALPGRYCGVAQLFESIMPNKTSAGIGLRGAAGTRTAAQCLPGAARLFTRRWLPLTSPRLASPPLASPRRSARPTGPPLFPAPEQWGRLGREGGREVRREGEEEIGRSRVDPRVGATRLLRDAKALPRHCTLLQTLRFVCRT